MWHFMMLTGRPVGLSLSPIEMASAASVQHRALTMRSIASGEDSLAVLKAVSAPSRPTCRGPAATQYADRGG